MTASVWDEARRELDVWSEQGLTARFWMRDDDATETSAPLGELHALTNRFEITIGLALIPGAMHHSLPDYLNGDAPNFRPMCHGWKHINHGSRIAPAEFGRGRPLTQLLEDAAAAREVFVRHFREAQPIFVPPFNRISGSLTRRLPSLGFAAVSAIPSRLSRRILDVRARIGGIPKFKLFPLFATPRIDVHIDLIDWRAHTAVDNRVIARALAQQLRGRRVAEPGAPIGLLTHHLVHDGPIWRLCDEILEVLRSHAAVEFLDLADWSSQNAGSSGQDCDVR